MAYTTAEKVLSMISEEELNQLTSESADAYDDDLVTESIAKADAEIDVYLGMVMAIPVVIQPLPSILTSLSVDMAIYHLFSRRSFMVDIRRQKYEDAIALLKLIAAGKAQLLPTEAPVVTVDITSEPRLFTRSTMSGF